MKTCPACKREYADDSLSFCLENGTALSQFNKLAETLRFETRHTGVVTQPARRIALWPFAVAGAGLVVLLLFVIAGLLFYTTSGKQPDRTNTETPATTTETASRDKTVQIASEQTQRPPSKSDIALELERVNNEMCNALVLKDFERIGQILGDDYRFVSDEGITLTKEEVMFLYETENIGYDYITNSDVKVDVDADLDKGVVNGRSRIAGQFRRERFTDSVYFSNTYEKRKDRLATRLGRAAAPLNL